MMRHFAFLLALCAVTSANAQQSADPLADLSVAQPAFALNTGPRLVIDGGHYNFHTVDGRYAPFATLMRNDGYRVSGAATTFTDQSLADVDILIIANALAAEDEEEWLLPNPSAFAPDEIAAVRRFVERGGSLLLIADHMPFGGAAQNLGAAFGVSFVNGYADDGDNNPDLFTLQNHALVADPILGDVTQVRTFTGSAFFAADANVRPLLRLGPGWNVLMTAEGGEFPPDTPTLSAEGALQGALLEVGAGRVAIFAEAAMFTAQVAGPQQTPMGLRAPGAEENKQFALNVMRWLARAP